MTKWAIAEKVVDRGNKRHVYFKVMTGKILYVDVL